MKEAVAVTGMAWATALGTGLDDVWLRLLQGRSGLREVESDHPLRNLLAAPLDSPPQTWDPLRRQVDLTSATLTRAMGHAGLGTRADPLIIVGTSFGPHLDDPDVDGLHAWVAEASLKSGVSRPPLSLSSACSSGSDAIAVGARLIEEGEAQACVCGGADILTPAKRLAHTALGTMSPTLLRSFDRRHDGTLLGEGAAFCVLEPLGSARRRGAPVYAIVRGSGASNDAASMAGPDPSGDGVLLALQRALTAAGAVPDEVAVVNAHGSGTQANDFVEAIALSRLFRGVRKPVVFATKGAFGHTLGATGAIEAIAVVMALRRRVAPAVYGLDDLPQDFPLPVPVGGPRELGSGLGVSVTLAFGGFNTALVFQAVPGDVG